MNLFSRPEQIQKLKEKDFDLFVIGGGANGAGIARDAAMRGLSVAMVEARDYCSGTSSKSSKLLHGGIRYLEQFHLGLVFEASKERRLHSQLLSPHMSKPVPFLIPIYPWSPHGRLAIGFGVFLYDLLALFRNHGSRVLSTVTTMREESRLEPKGLKGGVVYHDVVMDDARLGLENVHSAVYHGAVTANYIAVKKFDHDTNGKIKGVWLRDELDQSEFLVKAKCFVNAAGPWSDHIRKMDNPAAANMLRPTKGVHLLLPNHSLGKTHAFVLTAKADDRVFFSIPWFDRTLVGTTDTDYDPAQDGPLESIRANQNEIDYLMESVKRTFPGATVGPNDIQSTFAGLRPLVSAGESDPSAVSREHRIWQEDSGLLTIAGGKWTTYRTMSKELVDHAVAFLQKEYTTFGSVKECTTHLEPIVMLDGKKYQEHMNEYLRTLDPSLISHLQTRYGARWQCLADLALENPALREKIIPGEEDIMAEVVYSRESEMAVTFEDFLRRRTMLALKAPLLKHMDRIKIAATHFGGNIPSEQEVGRLQGLLHGS